MRREGLILIDHSDAPPVAGIPRGLFEAATLTCAHCNGVGIKSPTRTRPRGYCSRCDAYVCDSCDALSQRHGCRPFEKLVEEILKRT